MHLQHLNGKGRAKVEDIETWFGLVIKVVEFTSTNAASFGKGHSMRLHPCS
jgi:hypothetical protein